MSFSNDQPTARQPFRGAPTEDGEFGRWTWDSAADELCLTPAAAAMHGLGLAATVRTLTGFTRRIDPADRDRVVTTLIDAASSGEQRIVEYRLATADDARPRFITAWLVPAPRTAAARPLTAICHAAATAQPPTATPYAQPLAAVLSDITEGITVQLPNGDHIYGNPAAHAILGLRTLEELRALSAAERRRRFASRDEAGVLIPGRRFPTTRALRGEQPPETVIQLQPLDDTPPRWVAIQSTPLLDAAGNVQFVLNRLRDLTRERQREDQLRQSEVRYRNLFESNPLPMWVFDLESLRFVEVNDAAVHEYGWSQAEFQRLTLLDVRPEEDRPALLAKLDRITRHPDGLDIAGVWRHQRRDGSIFEAEVTTHALTIDGRPARLALVMNVTERLRHERRLERLYQLTAALAAAHDPRGVARVIGAYARTAGADAAAVAALSPVDQTVQVLHRVGYPARVPEQSHPFLLTDPTLLGEVIRTGRAIIAPSWQEFDRQHPELIASREFAGAAGSGAGLILPLMIDEHAIGALKMAFRAPRAFSDVLLDELRTIANLCAQALHRAQLYAVGQAARAKAEIAEHAARREAERIATLAGVSRTLAAAGLDYTAVGRVIVETIAGQTGDICILTHFTRQAEQDDTHHGHHRDPAVAADVVEWLASGWPSFLAPLAAPLTAAAASATGVIHARVEGPTPFPAVTSVMLLPFRAHGELIGVMTLIRLGPGLPYTEDDRVFCQELSDRAALAFDNATLYHEAQIAVRTRDEFLSAAAHELRTPVTTVKGYAQMLQRAQMRQGLASNRASQFLQAIDESTERLRVLTDDLLDVSRLRLGEMPLRLREFDLAALVSQIVTRYQSQYEPGHQLRFVAAAPDLTLTGDPDRIEQVLNNLIENAAKYSPGGEIVVTVGREGAGIAVAVRDHGIGLPQGTAETIFEPFRRAENAIREHRPGMGLGLAICDGIIRRHGGWIAAESAGEDHGSTFRFWLPRCGPA